MTSVSRAMYCDWVINALVALETATPQEVYRWIKANETVPSSELTRTAQRGEILFEKNVRWARFTLLKEGVISDREGWGVWTLV